MKRLEGKVAVITGGNSGIGLAAAKRLREEGAKIATFGRSRKTLDDAVKTIGNGVVAVQGDVAKLTDLDKLYAEISQKLGKIDVLFVNAGVAKFAPFAETSESTYNENFDINIKGAYFTIQKALPLLNDGASIILNTSVAGQTGTVGTSAYSATKAALPSLARTTVSSQKPKAMQPREPLRVVPAPLWLGRRRSAGSVASRISPRWRCSWRRTNQPGSPGRSFVPQAASLWPPECTCRPRNNTFG